MLCTERMVLHEDDCQITTLDDHRGRLSFRTGFSADSTPTQGYVLTGTGVVDLDGTEHQVGSGSQVFIPGSAEHGIRNTGAHVLRFFYALAADAFADIEYVFS